MSDGHIVVSLERGGGGGGEGGGMKLNWRATKKGNSPFLG